MKKNGFTLVELLGVIIVIVVLSLIAFPIIMNQFKKNKKEISSVTKALLEEATITYLDADPNKYQKVEGNIYCIALSQLVDTGALELPLIDPTTKLEIPLSHRVKVTIQSRQFIPIYIADENCVESRL